MTSKTTPCFEKSKGQRVSNRGLLKNRFEFFGVLNKGFLKIDAGELVMFEDISYTGQIKKDLFQGEGELKLPDGITIRGMWNHGSLISGRVIFKDINSIEYVEVNLKDNMFKFKTPKDVKPLVITDGMTLEFVEAKNEIQVAFKLNEVQGITIYITRKIPNLTLIDKHYVVSTTLAPLLYFKKDFHIEDSRVSFVIYPSYKVEYILRTIKSENRFNIRHMVIYPEGKCFMGKIDNIVKGDKHFNSTRLSMPGMFVDLDEFLIDNIKMLNYYEIFSLKTGNRRLIKKPDKKIKRTEIEKSVFTRLITAILQKKSVLKHLVSEEIDKCQMKFDWKGYRHNYFDDVLVVTKDPFDYQKRLSRNFLTNIIEKSLMQFNWMLKPDTYFHFQVLNE